MAAIYLSGLLPLYFCNEHNAGSMFSYILLYMRTDFTFGGGFWVYQIWSGEEIIWTHKYLLSFQNSIVCQFLIVFQPFMSSIDNLIIGGICWLGKPR